MPIVMLEARFAPNEEGLFTNSEGYRARLVDGELVDVPEPVGPDFLGTITDDDLFGDDEFPPFGSSNTYYVGVDGEEVVVTIEVDYDEDDPLE